MPNRRVPAWLLLALAEVLYLPWLCGVYLSYALILGPGALPGTRLVAQWYPAFANSVPVLIGYVLLTPTGSLPSPRWRWRAWAMGIARSRRRGWLSGC